MRRILAFLAVTHGTVRATEDTGYWDTLYPELFLDDCKQQEAALKALVSINRDCDKDVRWRNYKRLRRIPCLTENADGELVDYDGTNGVPDAPGIGQLNCVAEFLRQGTNVPKDDIVLYCQMYMKLKCEKSLP